MPKKKKVTTTTTTVVTTEEIVSAPSITRVILVVDRSGSMNSIRKQTFDNINEQIATLKRDAKKGGKTYVSYLQFDDVMELVFDNVPAEELQPIKEHQYIPRGSTALYDAQLRAILTLKKEGDPEDAAYLVVTLTDGQNNASREITQFELAKMIKEYEVKGNWTFTYMMANIDVNHFAKAMNVPLGNVMSYTADALGAPAAGAIMNSSLGQYMNSRSAGLRSVASFYSGTPEDQTTNIPVDPNQTTNFGELDKKAKAISQKTTK
jgi:uncharacterized protein YegL